jgi:ferredoxin
VELVNRSVNTIIYEEIGMDGRLNKGKVVLPDGTEVDAEDAQTPISDEVYYIVPGKCTECKGFHDEPQCAAVCPVDCIPDDEHVETEETKHFCTTTRNWLREKNKNPVCNGKQDFFKFFDIIAI